MGEVSKSHCWNFWNGVMGLKSLQRAHETIRNRQRLR
jgi:hypothetical protein